MTRKQRFQAMLVGVMFCIMLCICSRIESTYTRKAIVTKVTNDIVTVEDNTGKIWEFYGTNFDLGDNVVLMMDSNHTDNIIEDDTIIKVKRTK